ncbi:MAG: CPBP family intramembrane metalloprotease, partial [Clostridia bacterium]|nr:CPBP family intramembrane metalloprotease [Clostridia bacterium]
LSSIMFSIFHFSPSQLIYPICFGLILSIVYLRTNNILFPMLLHFINNALSLSIQYFSNSTGAFSHSASTLIYAIITFVVWILIMIRLFNDFKSKCLTQPTETNLKKNKPTHISNEYDKNNNDKLNNYVLYGSIIIMLCIYILLNI